MSTLPPAEPDDPYAELDEDTLEEELGLEARELDAEGWRTVDGAQSDEPLDPAMIPVIEAGGGVAEGFEQAEALLVDNASEGPLDGTKRIIGDAFGAEAEDDRAVYGEADDEHPGGADR